MNLTVDLLWVSGGIPAPVWRIGNVQVAQSFASSIARALDEWVGNSNADAVLLWDASLDAPDQGLVQKLVGSSVDCWHAGLRLGMGGLPGIMDFITPTWMLNRDPTAGIEATSWRLSLRACLVRTEVLRSLGGPRAEFQTLEAAALEMGHRWIRRGALMRHVPSLLATSNSQLSTLNSQLPFSDELRLAYYRFGRKWAGWALFRAIMTRYVSVPSALSAWRAVMPTPRPAEPAPLRSAEVSGQWSEVSGPDLKVRNRWSVVSGPAESARVSVLIPTLDRYPYLRTLLGQLRQQTVKPLEIIIIDQTTRERRQENLAEDFPDLPIKLLWQDEPGQCTSRNAGLQIARGDYILFIDDDDEVPANLIEAHLRTLNQFQCEVSCGVADEVGAGPLPPDFRFVRASDVFPTNNSLMKREVLCRSGLFDLAYNRGQRADGDLGMRIFLTGAQMILNPGISVLHHHAPSGGLRKHKARTVTYAKSRRSVFSRALATVSEIYLGRRYFPEAHVREMLWENILGTFSVRGRLAKRVVKLVVSTLCLPHSLGTIRNRVRQARELARCFPQIPTLEPAHSVERSRSETPVLSSHGP